MYVCSLYDRPGVLSPPALQVQGFLFQARFTVQTSIAPACAGEGARARVPGLGILHKTRFDTKKRPEAEASGPWFLVELSFEPRDCPLVLFEDVDPWFSTVAAIGADTSKLVEEGAEGILIHAVNVAQIVSNVPEFCGCAGSEEPIERSV